MRASNNAYLSRLDHLRAFAAFQVFAFHFLHHAAFCGVGICIVKIYRPFALFDFFNEGQMGVSLFMCLSGYIFAYLTHDAAINPLVFCYNRLLRLMPLIAFWEIVVKLFYTSHPTTGTWSVYIEIEYYALFPILHIYMRSYKVWPLALLLACLFAGRLAQWYHDQPLNDWAYYSLGGRGDQLLLGSIAFYAERWIKTFALHKRIFHCMGAAGLAGIVATYQYYTLHGGFIHFPHTGFYWVVSPLLDGVFFSLIILCYLQLPIPAMLDRPLSAVGRWAYSIYLNQFYFIPLFFIAVSRVMPMPENFYARLGIMALVAFPLGAMLSSLTYKMIEKPFLRFRRNYFLKDTESMSLSSIVKSMIASPATRANDN